MGRPTTEDVLLLEVSGQGPGTPMVGHVVASLPRRRGRRDRYPTRVAGKGLDDRTAQVARSLEDEARGLCGDVCHGIVRLFGPVWKSNSGAPRHRRCVCAMAWRVHAIDATLSIEPNSLVDSTQAWPGRNASETTSRCSSPMPVRQVSF